jgi:type I restriction enzyme S subunit
LPEQRAIAHILGTLDDKIELNRRMNETLEAMARVLFRSWFIDFDPVHAKAEGRDLGLPKYIADLFSDSLQESELGWIPQGWRVGPLLEQAQLLSGGTPKTDHPEYWNGDVPWASAKDVSQCGQCFLISTERTITKLGLQESSTQVIPALSTIVVARGATTGRMTMFGADIAMNQTCYALRSTLGSSFALYCHTRHVMDDLVQTGHGTVFNTITTSTFQASHAVLAPQDVLHGFERMVAPLFQQILVKEHEYQGLLALRDTLLPKLISGELRVRQVETIVEEAKV